jgi:flagellar protein FliS
MSLPNPYAQYRQNSVETATPTRLVVMLYDGAIRFLSQALAAMQAKNHVQQSVLIGKAQAILAYLRETLDVEVGKAFAESLDRILAALMHSLTEANIRNKPEPVEEAIKVLRELRESWAEVDRQCQAGKTSSARELIAA